MTNIAEALVATAVGLLVAIPAVAAFNLFQRIVSTTLANTEALEPRPPRAPQGDGRRRAPTSRPRSRRPRARGERPSKASTRDAPKDADDN